MCAKGPETLRGAAYAVASELDLLEVHDCFSITGLVSMEDLFVSETAVRHP